MKEFTFHNVTITLAADSGEAAYTRLCALLAADSALEYETSTYSVDGGPVRPSHELWPERDGGAVFP